jgi:hypothetical protein
MRHLALTLLLVGLFGFSRPSAAAHGGAPAGPISFGPSVLCFAFCSDVSPLEVFAMAVGTTTQLVLDGVLIADLALKGAANPNVAQVATWASAVNTALAGGLLVHDLAVGNASHPWRELRIGYAAFSAASLGLSLVALLHHTSPVKVTPYLKPKAGGAEGGLRLSGSW